MYDEEEADKWLNLLSICTIRECHIGCIHNSNGVNQNLRSGNSLRRLLYLKP